MLVFKLSSLASHCQCVPLRLVIYAVQVNHHVSSRLCSISRLQTFHNLPISHCSQFSSVVPDKSMPYDRLRADWMSKQPYLTALLRSCYCFLHFFILFQPPSIHHHSQPPTQQWDRLSPLTFKGNGAPLIYSIGPSF